MLRRLDIVEHRIVASAAANAPIELFIGPDEEERRHLVEELKIDQHTLASALDPNEQGRIEFYPGHVAMIVKRPKQYSSEDNFLFKISSIGIFVFRDKLVFIVAEDTLTFDGKRFLQINSTHDLVLRIISHCIVHFQEHLRVFSMISDELEQKISTAMENRHLLNLFTLEKSLVYYLNAISSNRRVVDKLKINAERLKLGAEDLKYLDDLIIDNEQCHEVALTYADVLASLMSARVSIVNNNLNVLMKTLTLFMIALMLPTLVISIFSMNVRLPIDQENGIGSFWIILVLALTSCGAAYGYWRWKKW